MHSAKFLATLAVKWPRNAQRPFPEEGSSGDHLLLRLTERRHICSGGRKVSGERFREWHGPRRRRERLEKRTFQIRLPSSVELPSPILDGGGWLGPFGRKTLSSSLIG